jgi:hypothetical protein
MSFPWITETLDRFQYRLFFNGEIDSNMIRSAYSLLYQELQNPKNLRFDVFKYYIFDNIIKKYDENSYQVPDISHKRDIAIDILRIIFTYNINKTILSLIRIMQLSENMDSWLREILIEEEIKNKFTNKIKELPNTLRSKLLKIYNRICPNSIIPFDIDTILHEKGDKIIELIPISEKLRSPESIRQICQYLKIPGTDIYDLIIYLTKNNNKHHAHIIASLLTADERTTLIHRILES